VSTAPEDQVNPSIVFDGVDYIVVWEDYRELPSDIYGAIIDTSGVVIDSFLAIAQPGPQRNPKLSRGPGTKTLLTYCGWAEYINAHPANALRIWGKFHPELGITEHDEEITKNYTLNVCPNPFTTLTTISFSTEQSVKSIEMKIYDVSGRLVRDLYCAVPHAPCAMQISWDGTDQADRKLPSGVYFIQLTAGAESVVEKVLLVR
jgi:hypothetical protein